MSATNLIDNKITSKMNSDAASRSMDVSANLENFVRLSFCSDNPMMHVALAEGRISVPMLLKIKLEVVSRPGVCFADCNATRLDARKSTNPSIVHFDVVKKKSRFDVAPSLQRFYQAEVLIPSPLPPHLIDFPSKPIKLPVKKKVTAHKVNAKSMKVSEATRKDDCPSPHKIKRVEICSEFSEPESVEAKSVELCEGE